MFIRIGVDNMQLRFCFYMIVKAQIIIGSILVLILFSAQALVFLLAI